MFGYALSVLLYTTNNNSQHVFRSYKPNLPLWSTIRLALTSCPAISCTRIQRTLPEWLKPDKTGKVQVLRVGSRIRVTSWWNDCKPTFRLPSCCHHVACSHSCRRRPSFKPNAASTIIGPWDHPFSTRPIWLWTTCARDKTFLVRRFRYPKIFVFVTIAVISLRNILTNDYSLVNVEKFFELFRFCLITVKRFGTADSRLTAWSWPPGPKITRSLSGTSIRRHWCWSWTRLWSVTITASHTLRGARTVQDWQYVDPRIVMRCPAYIFFRFDLK